MELFVTVSGFLGFDFVETVLVELPDEGGVGLVVEKLGNDLGLKSSWLDFKNIVVYPPYCMAEVVDL
jgi:hypothetical protein